MKGHKIITLAGGATGASLQSLDWSKHQLGSVETWPNDLKSTLRILFHSHQPMLIWWGPNLLQFHNDAMLPCIRKENQDQAIGQEAKNYWPESWHKFKPFVDSILNNVSATCSDDQIISTLRNGKLEDVSWNCSFSPITDTNNSVVGVLAILFENQRAANNQIPIADELVDTLESISDSFISIDKNWIITRVNAHHERISQKKRKDQIGKNFLQLFFSDSIYYTSKSFQAYQKAMKTRVQGRFEDHYEPLDMWTEARIFPKKDGGLAIFFADISERKNKEDRLHLGRLKLESIIAKSPAGVALMYGPTFIFEKINEEWAQLSGQRDYLGKTFADTYPELKGTAFLDSLALVYETGVTYQNNDNSVRVEISPGVFEDRYYDYSYIRINKLDGTAYGIFAHSVNVTDRVLARKRVEAAKEAIEIEALHVVQERAKFAAAFEAVSDGIFIFDSEGNPIYMNEGAAKVFGLSSAKDLMQRVEFYFNNLELSDMNNNIIPIAEWPVSKALRGESFKDWQIQAYRRDINKRWVWSSSGELAKQPGINLTLAVVVLRDITEQVRAEGELRTAKKDAEKASLTKTEFLANMSHEIRTPLTAILGFSEMMKEATSTYERAEYSATISRNGKSLTRIIDDILDLSKVEAGRLELEKLPFVLRDLVSEVIDLFSDNAATKDVKLSYEISANAPVIVKSDPTRIRQILINLIGNAMKFTEVGFVSLQVETRPAVGNPTHIDLVIRDSGIGITPVQCERLFEPFSQADQSTTRKFGGSGLGLALSKRLANVLGGDVWLKNSLYGQGSTFVASVEVLPHGQEMQMPAPDMYKIETVESLKGLKVLLVEDVPDNQLLIKMRLGKAGAIIEIANNGLEGIQKALTKEFDIVLMDMQMPVLDGYEATYRLRKAGYKKPIIAITAHAMEEERRRTKAAGCDHHLTKPLDFIVLKKTITSLIFPKSTTVLNLQQRY